MACNIENNKINVINPVTGAVIDSLSMTTKEELEALLIENKNYKEWQELSGYKRCKIIKKFRKNLVKRMDEIIDTLSLENGKKKFESTMEVFISLEHMKQSTYLASEYLKTERRNVGLLKTKKAYVHYFPYGTAGIISPWNYPLILTAGPVVESLLAGNNTIIKPSEQTPLTARLLKEIWDNSSHYHNAFKLINGDGKIGRALVESEYTDIICFTGSTAVGKKIAISCAERLKPVILELGGKDPMIVLNDANIERAINAALWGGFSNAGQTCLSVERLYVEESIFEDFKIKLGEAIKNLSVGPDNDDDIGPISTQDNYTKIIKQINQAREEDIQIIQSDLNIENSWFISPTIIVNPPKELEVCQTETFGPVITLFSFKSLNEIIDKINETGYGLGGSIFGKDKKRINETIQSLRCGAISVNDINTYYGITDLPFGGVGLSGIGRVHGRDGLRAFSIQKSVTRNKITLNSELWWFKDYKKWENLLKKTLKWLYR